VADVELESAGEAELGGASAFEGLPKDGDDRFDEGPDVRLVASDVAGVGHGRAGVVVRGGHHDVLAG